MGTCGILFEGTREVGICLQEGWGIGRYLVFVQRKAIEKWHKVISDGGGGQRRKGSNSHDIIIIGFDKAVVEVKKKKKYFIISRLVFMSVRVLRSFSAQQLSRQLNGILG